jgi:hypothetical protein
MQIQMQLATEAAIAILKIDAIEVMSNNNNNHNNNQATPP